MSGSEINVISRTQIIIVEPTSGSVSVINAGPAGPGVIISGQPMSFMVVWGSGSGETSPLTFDNNDLVGPPMAATFYGQNGLTGFWNGYWCWISPESSVWMVERNIMLKGPYTADPDDYLAFEGSYATYGRHEVSLRSLAGDEFQSISHFGIQRIGAGTPSVDAVAHISSSISVVYAAAWGTQIKGIT